MQVAISGTRNENRLKLHIPKGELYTQYRIGYIDITRALVQNSPELRSRLPWDKLTTAQKNVEAVMEPEAHLDWEVRPRCERVFWRILAENDLRFTVERHPYQCHYHLNGPSMLIERDEILHKLTQEGSDAQKSRLSARLAALDKDLVAYNRHLTQYRVLLVFHERNVLE